MTKAYDPTSKSCFDTEDLPDLSELLERAPPASDIPPEAHIAIAEVIAFAYFVAGRSASYPDEN